jgi:hypothetical protein
MYYRLFLTGFLLGLLFSPKDGDSTSIRTTGLQDVTSEVTVPFVKWKFAYIAVNKLLWKKNINKKTANFYKQNSLIFLESHLEKL